MSTDTGTGAAPATLSSAQLARRRRTASWRRGWTQFRSHRSGMIGLGILFFFVAAAVAAPLLADRSGLDVTAANGPVLGSAVLATTGSAPTRTAAPC